MMRIITIIITINIINVIIIIIIIITIIIITIIILLLLLISLLLLLLLISSRLFSHGRTFPDSRFFSEEEEGHDWLTAKPKEPHAPDLAL